MSLCSACAEHFNFSHPAIVAQIKQIKEIRIRLPGDRSESDVDFLRRDLERYQQGVSTAQALGSRQEVLWPTPWAKKDISHDDGTYFKVWSITNDAAKIRTYGELGSSKDCRMCIVLLSVIQYVSKTRAVQPNTSANIITYWLASDYLQLHRLQVDYNHNNLRKDFVSFSLRLTMDCSDTSLPRIPTSLSTDDPSCTEFLQKALSNCLLNHRLCASSQIDSWMPSRLLDVGILPYRNPDFILLAERDDIQKADEVGERCRVQYFTLSHVWGKSRPACLTQANYAEMKKGISLSELPICFRDAVKVTRDLGGRYLWIDALCIVQDSADDWASEAASMDQVYANGVCNIAACDIQDSNDSLFSSREHPQGGAAIIQRRKFIAGDSTEDVVFTLMPDWPKLILESCNLYGRAWVIQERWLSRRIIHFSQFPVWECSAGLVTEGNPPFEEADETSPVDVFNEQDESRERKRHWLFLPPDIDVHSNMADKERLIINRWWEILRRYGRASLTFRTDKLVALGGVAKAFWPLIGEDNRYYVGIWGGKYFLLSLLWCSGNRVPHDRFDENGVYIAPSWSWASTNREFDSEPWRDNSDIVHSLVELVSCRIVPKHGDVFGQLSAAELVFRGTLLSICDSTYFHCCYDLEGESSRGKDSQVYFLPLAELVSKRMGERFVGLLLRLAERPGEKPRYKRVGAAPRFPRKRRKDDSFLDDEQWSKLENLSTNLGQGGGELITII